MKYFLVKLWVLRVTAQDDSKTFVFYFAADNILVIVVVSIEDVSYYLDEREM